MAHHHPPTRKTAVLAALLTFLTLLPALSPPSLSAPTPLSADLQVWLEDFEGAFPGTNWNVTDNNPGNGSDYWGPSAYRRFAGNGSAWSASVGSQLLYWNATGNPPRDPYTTGFETGAPNWNFSDDNPLEGDDYWNVSGFRYHGGTSSLWCAQVGDNNYTSDTNANSHVYDNEMDAFVWRTVDFARVAAINQSTVTLTFWYLTATENGVDFLDVVFDNGSGWSVAVSYTGDSAGWQVATTTLPVDATRFGFRYLSDSGGVLEGAYIDDIALSATHLEPNQGLHIYDIQMNATMWRAVDLSPYATALMEYRYWLDAQVNDSLWAMYYMGGVWTYLDNRSGTSGGFQIGSVAIPVNATRVGFRFLSNITGHREGAYLDNVRVVGHVNSIVCTGQATVSPPTGLEASTVFTYSVTPTQGLLPYSWSWNFNGSVNTTQAALRVYGDVGTYNGTVTVTDAAGQTCTTSPPSVTVTHDTSAVSVYAGASTQVVEGQNITLFGLDRRGHPLSLTWTLTPPSCGILTSGTGFNTTLRTAVTAGGALCQVKGSYAAANATANITVLHDFSEILVTPPEEVSFEGATVNLSAADAKGHALNFIWTTSCGTLSVYNGPSTRFDAGNNGGSICRLTISLGGAFTIVNITVLQDTSEIKVTPDFAFLIEGQAIAVGALNRFDHIIDVNWSISPSACGSMSIDHGNASVFTSSDDSGGLSCSVRASVGSVSGAAVINVTHDTSALSLSSGAAALLEGETMQLTFVDVHDHPFSAAWRVDPTPCGTLSPASGGIVNFTAGNSAAGLSCVITASVNAQAWRANVTVSHGPPASVDVAPAVGAVREGTPISLGASVLDAYGHILSNRTIEWSSSCAQLSSSEGPTTSATPPATAGGQTCIVVAAYGTFTATITLSIAYAPPYTVTVAPASASLSAGQTQEFTATVTDANGVTPKNVSIRWTSTCGGLSSQGGEKVTVTAPSDLGGATCKVTASITVLGETSASEASVATGMSLLIPVLIVVPIAAGAFLFLRWWKKRPPKFEQIGEGLMDEKKFEVEIR